MKRSRGNSGRTSIGMFDPVISRLPALSVLASFALGASISLAEEQAGAAGAPSGVSESNPSASAPVGSAPSVPPASAAPSTPASTNSAAGEVPIMAVPLASKDPLNHYLTRERVESLQERIRPSVQNIEARGGAARFMWNQRHESSSILQLINPLAPTEYGVSSVTYYQVPASVATGHPPLPRGFRDDRTHEANGLFFRAGW